jgi:hypothetical protein
MPSWSLPRSLADLLTRLRCCFTAPKIGRFMALLVEFLTQPGQRTVTGMLVGAHLSGVWHQATAHRSFSAAADQLTSSAWSCWMASWPGCPRPRRWC